MRLVVPLVVVGVLLVLELSEVSCGAPKAAIYVDNGRGQTAIDRMMTTDEKREIELEFLNLLGLPNRPRKINKATVKKSAPKFLLDIYQSLLDEDEDDDEHTRRKRSAELGFSGEEQQKIDQSDVIMTLESIITVSRYAIWWQDDLCSRMHHVLPRGLPRGCTLTTDQQTALEETILVEVVASGLQQNDSQNVGQLRFAEKHFWVGMLLIDWLVALKGENISKEATITALLSLLSLIQAQNSESVVRGGWEIRSDIKPYLEPSANDHHVDSVRHERGKRLWFDVSELPVAEDIVGAELRIYQNQSLSRHRGGNYTVTAYQLTDSTEGENELEYISEVETSFDFTGWLGINVTRCLASWVAFPNSNRGIYLSVHQADKSHEVRPEDIGLVTVRGEDTTQPFMVAFLKASTNVKPRTRRELRTRVKKSDITNFYQRSIEQDTRSTCKINTLYISFKDLKWQDWIIAPEGYAAYFCHGECNFPLNAHMNASNHAIVQTLVHLMTPTKFPKSCCAPTKLSPISVLYFLDDHNVVLKKYRQMVVKTCGCR